MDQSGPAINVKMKNPLPEWVSGGIRTLQSCMMEKFTFRQSTLRTDTRVGKMDGIAAVSVLMAYLIRLIAILRYAVFYLREQEYGRHFG